jgi:hypothetical protein
VNYKRLSEEEWLQAYETGDSIRKQKIPEWTSYLLCTFCHSLRGWEGVKAIVSMLRTQIVDDERAEELGIDSHLGLPLYGRFKSCGNSNSYLYYV